MAAAEADSAPSPASVAALGGRDLDYRPPKTVSIEFSAGAKRFIDAESISPVTVRDIVEHPDADWQGENPYSENRPTVAVRHDCSHGVVYDPENDSAYVIAVQPVPDLYAQRRRMTSGFRSSGGGGPKRAAVSSLKELISAAEAAGLEYVHGKTHGQFRRPDRPELGHSVVPVTPSDSRSWANCTAELRRRFDADI